MQKLAKVDSVKWGADPELFLKRDGKVIGAEKAIPKMGLKSPDPYHYGSIVIIDGVQVELNPRPAETIEGFGKNVAVAIATLQKHLANTPVTIGFEDFIDVGREELDSLSPGCRILGCLPSENIYGNRPITIDVKEYTKRSTGGHVHFGISSYSYSFHEKRVGLIPSLDVFMGSICTLVDRSPNCAERRQNYGRAGEYRKQPHGIEYRTLSNFWLRNYTLLNMVFGLAEIALATYAARFIAGEDIEKDLIKVVDMVGAFEPAINFNRFDLARANFETIRPFLANRLPDTGFVLNPSTLDKFCLFAEGVRVHGLEHYFPQDSIEHWQQIAGGGKVTGFAEFLATI